MTSGKAECQEGSGGVRNGTTMADETARLAVLGRLPAPRRGKITGQNRESSGAHGAARLMAYRAVDHHVCERVRGFLRRRRKVSPRGARQCSDQVVFGKRGVVPLRRMHLGPEPATA